jgi:hypothetical protein
MEYFAPSLDQAWSYLGAFVRTLKKKSSPGGYQLCRFSFGVARILVQKKHKEIYMKLITTCEDGEINRKSIVSIKPYKYDV